MHLSLFYWAELIIMIIVGVVAIAFLCIKLERLNQKGILIDFGLILLIVCLTACTIGIANLVYVGFRDARPVEVKIEKFVEGLSDYEANYALELLENRPKIE